MKIILVVANSIDIIVALYILELMTDYYIIYHLSIIYIFSYICFFYYQIGGFLDCLLNNIILMHILNVMQKVIS